MGVVISEFEVVTEPQAEQTAGTAPSGATTPAQPAAQDIERIIRHQAERFARISAH